MLGVLDSLRIGLAPVRVSVEAADPVRQASLAALVAAAGHEVVPYNQAEMTLADRYRGYGLPELVMSSDPALGEGRSVLPATAGARQLDAALRAVAAGLIVHGPPELPDAGLTPRETDVLACLVDGAANKVIARRLGISQHTVKFHVEAIFTKLGVTSRAEAVAKSLRRRLVGFES